jgi:uncharacterized protein (DUF1778 family)
MKTGRPRISETEKKASIAGVRLSSEERALLEKAASSRQKKLSEWMRDTLIRIATKQLA